MTNAQKTELAGRIKRSIANPLQIAIDGVGTFSLYIDTTNAIEACMEALQDGKAKFGPFVAMFEPPKRADPLKRKNPKKRRALRKGGLLAFRSTPKR